MSYARTAAVLCAAALLCFVPGGVAFAQTAPASGAAGTAGGERTVEEASLQESVETLVIGEQSRADSKDQKLVALQYIKQAIDEGRKGENVRESLAYLALETSYVVARNAGGGKPTNDFPDIRAKACDYLGEFKTVAAKDTLVKVALSDREPMVLSAAVRSLGKIGINDADEVTTLIAFLVNRFDVLYPDNSLAFESLVALERIGGLSGGIKDPAAIRAIMRIAGGNYITPVKIKANQLLDTLRKTQGK
jgi:hypothetical protein